MGVNVDWHLRDAVSKTMSALGDQYNATVLVAACVDGLEGAVDKQRGRAWRRFVSCGTRLPRLAVPSAIESASLDTERGPLPS